MSRKPGRGGHKRGGHQRGGPPPADAGLGNIQQGMAGLTLGTGQTGTSGAQPPLGQVGPGMPGQQPPHLPGQFIPGMHQQQPQVGQQPQIQQQPQCLQQLQQFMQMFQQQQQQQQFMGAGPQVAGQLGQVQPQAQIPPGCCFAQAIAGRQQAQQFPKDFDAVDEMNLKHHTNEDWMVNKYLAEGGFGTVYEVSAGKDQLGLKKGDVMAVKIMKVSHSQPDAKQKISNMAHEIAVNRLLMQSPGHQNVLICVQAFQALDLINSMERAYMIMEICSIGAAIDLMRTLPSGQGYSEDETRWLVMNLARGIEFLKNTVGMAHLDIKPDNILMFKNPDPNAQPYQQYLPKLCDFSLASIRDTNRDPPDYCTTNFLRTTIGWGPPEAFPLGSQQPYNAFPVDVYTLGTVAYFLRTHTELLNTSKHFGPIYEATHVNMVKGQQTDVGMRVKLIIKFKEVNQGFGNLLFQMLRERPQDRPAIETVLQHPWLQPPNP